jgi:hypothetical protein
MSLLDHLEKLINKHGSSAILREHLALVRSEQITLEHKYSDLNAEYNTLKSENAELKKELWILKEQISALNSGNDSGYVCDHCGSPQLKRIGNRKDPTFGDLGVKQSVFTCMVCAKESAFI